MTNTHVAPLEGAQTISMLINGERVQASNGAVFGSTITLTPLDSNTWSSAAISSAYSSL